MRDIDFSSLWISTSLYMIRSLFIILVLSSFSTIAQDDPFEKIVVPNTSNDFVCMLNFWRQLNSVENEYLLKLDSIQFYVNHDLKYVYKLTEFRRHIEITTFTDSVLRASSDSIFNRELNSYDIYFTDIELNRFMECRKFINERGLYYRVEQFSDGQPAVITNRTFDKQGNVIEEMNEFILDSSTYQMKYKRQGFAIKQRQVIIRGNGYESQYTTDYNDKSGVIRYSYHSNDSQGTKKCLLKVTRSKDNLAIKAEGLFDNQPLRFTFSYSSMTVEIHRENIKGPTVFKLAMF